MIRERVRDGKTTTTVQRGVQSAGGAGNDLRREGLDAGQPGVWDQRYGIVALETRVSGTGATAVRSAKKR